jgi:hypothetical protein
MIFIVHVPKATFIHHYEGSLRLLDLQIHVQSVPIATKVVSSNFR